MASQSPFEFRSASVRQGIHMARQYGNSTHYEAKLDLSGSKHLESISRSHTVYTIGEALGSAHWTFLLSGEGNVNALRRSLATHLPLHHITDEYGAVKPPGEISSHHLPTLQAKLWRELPQEHAATSAAPTPFATPNRHVGPFLKTSVVSTSAVEPDNDRMSASQLEAIASLLDVGHVFVAGGKHTLRCFNPTCHQQDHENASRPPILTLEPYYHWGTLTPSELLLARGKILAFRRNGEKSQDPLWTLAMKRLDPADSLAYCVQCLEMFMTNKAAAWPLIVSTDAPSQPEHLTEKPSSKNQIQMSSWSQNHPAHRSPAFALSSASQLDAMAGVSASAHQSAGEAPESSHDPSHAELVFQLDGTIDTRKPTQRHMSPRSSKYTCNLTRKDEKDDHHVAGGLGGIKPGHPHHNDGTLKTLPVTFTINKAAVQLPPVESSALHQAQTRTSTSSPPSKTLTSQLQDLEKSLNSHHPKSSGRTTVICKSTKKRQFGREVNTNSINQPSSKFTSKKKANKAELMEHDGRVLLMPVVDAAAQGSSTAAEYTATDTEHNDIANTLDPMPSSTESQEITGSDAAQAAVERTASTRVERRTLKSNSKAAGSRQREDGGMKKTTPSKGRTRKPLLQSQAAKKLSPPPQNAAPKPQPPFSPIFAKRIPLTDADYPPHIDRHTYEAHVNATPLPTDLICICKKPAHTLDVQIVQCSNQGCGMRWFHRACLDKRGKLSIRFGTMVCMVCRDEKAIRDMADVEGWNTGSLDEEEAKLALSSRELVDNLPGPGAVEHVVHPYGFGMPVMEPEPVIEKDERGLGSLARIGYAQSRPQQFVEAYGNAEAWKRIADEQWGKAKTVEYEDGEGDDEFDEEEEEEEEEEYEFIEDPDDEGKKDPSKYWMGAKIVRAI